MSTFIGLARSADDLWFRRRPGRALLVAAVLFAAVFTLRAASGGPTEAYAMLYVLPVALLAVAFGLQGGLAGSITAVMLMVTWAYERDVQLGPLAWTARVVPFVVLGVLLGYATDRARSAEIRQQEAEAVAVLHQQAIEINDSLVQNLAAARWSLDQGKVDDGMALLDQTIADAQARVSSLLRRAGMGEQTSRIHEPTDPDAHPSG